MAKAGEWAGKVLTLARGGNTPAAIAQIKVAPTVKDLKQLREAIAAAGLTGRWPNLDTAIEDSISAVAAPRLHRSP